MADTPTERRLVTIYTTFQRVEGELHVRKGARVSDCINETRDFIPLTNARVYSLSGNLIHSRSTLMVNRAFIVALDDEPVPGREVADAPAATSDAL